MAAEADHHPRRDFKRLSMSPRDARLLFSLYAVLITAGGAATFVLIAGYIPAGNKELAPLFASSAMALSENAVA